MPNNMLVNDQYLKSKSNIREKTYLTEKQGGKTEKEEELTEIDLHNHLESNVSTFFLCQRKLDQISWILPEYFQNMLDVSHWKKEFWRDRWKDSKGSNKIFRTNSFIRFGSLI
jgi:hypothetical protein